MASLTSPRVPILPGGDFVITIYNAHELDLFNEVKINSKEHWHKFIIKKGSSLEKEFLLEKILNSVSPLDLVAVKVIIVLL